MPSPDWWRESPGLRSVFGAVVAAAEQRASTADVWQAVRDAAGAAVQRTLGTTLGRAPTQTEIDQGSRNLLRGVNAVTMNSVRAAAGYFVRAHAALTALDPNEQITANAIARPPWAITVNAGRVQEQYRIRVLRQVEFRGFTTITRNEWATYNLVGPLTSVADALDQANGVFARADYNRGTSVKAVLDYVIEAV